MSKKQEVATALKAGWVSAPDLMAKMGWTSDTLRGVVSSLAKTEKFKIERQRIDGVTSYRVAPEA